MYFKQTQLFFFYVFFITIYSNVRLLKDSFLSHLEQAINVDKQVNC